MDASGSRIAGAVEKNGGLIFEGLFRNQFQRIGKIQRQSLVNIAVNAVKIVLLDPVDSLGKDYRISLKAGSKGSCAYGFRAWFYFNRSCFTAGAEEKGIFSIKEAVFCIELVVSFCYSDYSSNTVPQMSGMKVSVPLNNLVYIGINMADSRLSNPYLRYAISSAVDRNELVTEA